MAGKLKNEIVSGLEKLSPKVVIGVNGVVSKEELVVGCNDNNVVLIIQERTEKAGFSLGNQICWLAKRLVDLGWLVGWFTTMLMRIGKRRRKESRTRRRE